MKLHYLINLCVIFASCTQSSQWVYDEIASNAPTAQLCYSPTNKFNSLELKFLQGDFGTIAYLSPTNGIFSSKEVTLVIDQQAYKEQATLLSGNQTLLLTEFGTKKLLDSLKEDKSCVIFIDSFYCKIDPDQKISLLGS